MYVMLFARSRWCAHVRTGADRGDVVKGTPDIFFRQLKKYKNDEVPPVFVRRFFAIL